MKYLSLFAIKTYQFFKHSLVSLIVVMSPPDLCRFDPTCAEYAKQAFEKYNFGKALGLTINRLRKCHPLGKSGYDPVP